MDLFKNESDKDGFDEHFDDEQTSTESMLDEMEGDIAGMVAIGIPEGVANDIAATGGSVKSNCFYKINTIDKNLHSFGEYTWAADKDSLLKLLVDDISSSLLDDFITFESLFIDGEEHYM